jgi:hypothetical protein
MGWYNGNYIKEFKDPIYEKSIKNWQNIVKTLAVNFYKNNLDFDIIKVSPQQICHEPNEVLINKAVQDAFSDIKRLKDYHLEVKTPENIKFASYIGYWLSRAKPFSLIPNTYEAVFKGQQSDEQKRAKINFCYTVNEIFISEFMMTVIFYGAFPSELIGFSDVCLKMREEKNVRIIPVSQIHELLYYHLLYRSHGAKELELFLTGLLACPTQMRKERNQQAKPPQV